MARPGGNTTGISIFASELDVKRLEILHEVVPTAPRIGVLADPTTVSTAAQLETTARALGIALVTVTAGSRDEVDRALDGLAASGLGAVNVLASPILGANHDLIIEKLNRARLPAIYQWPERAVEGGLLAYGPRVASVWRQLAGMVDKVLRGADPVDLPIEQPTKFALVINLKTAASLGVAIPQPILMRADEVIE